MVVDAETTDNKDQKKDLEQSQNGTVQQTISKVGRVYNFNNQRAQNIYHIEHIDTFNG